MATSAQSVTEALHAEIERVPEDRRALLLRLVHSFRVGVEQEIEQSVGDIDPRDSLRQALREVKAGKTQPLEGLWDRVGL